MPVEKLGEPARLRHLVPNLSQRLECGATKAREKQIMAKGETERAKDKQALETIFYLNTFTSHGATKT